MRDVILLPMVYHFLLYFTTLIFDLFASIRLAPDEKDLQIANAPAHRRNLGDKGAEATPLARL